MNVKCPLCGHRARIRSDIESMPICGDCLVYMESPVTKAINDVMKEIAENDLNHSRFKVSPIQKIRRKIA